ncbi:MAG: hypothetical protein ABL958_05815 [Bdellovibrionia bacterium]
MKFSMKNKFVWISALVFTACAPSRPYNEPKLYEEMRVSDVVKNITPSIKDPADEKSFDQQSYTVGPESRMLIMYSSLGNQVDKINTADGGKVLLEISLENVSDAERAAGTVRLCPVTSKWMMLATWERAFPRKKWNAAGGDFDMAGCLTPELYKPEVKIVKTGSTTSTVPTPSPQPSPRPAADGTLFFDITRWYLDYPKGRNVNLGLILISSEEMRVMGDRSGSRSPRLYWYERDDAFRTYYQFSR